MSASSVLAILITVCFGGVAFLWISSGSSDSGGSCATQQHEGALAYVLNQGDQPVANAGDSQTVLVGSTVILNGSGSEPSEGATIANYTWQISLPVQGGEKAVIKYGEVTEFVANHTGRYDVNLTIRDSNNLTDWNMVYVIVKEAPKTFLEAYWVALLIGGLIAAYALYHALKAARRVSKGLPVISVSTREKSRLYLKKLDKVNRQLLRNPMGLVGAVLLTAFLLIAIFGPIFAPYDIKVIDPVNKFQKPSRMHWLGTDQQGVDIFSELLVGARTSIIIGVLSAVIASFLGAAVGLYSGYVGGWKDEVTMRLNDIVLSIPWLVLMIVVAALVGTINLVGIILIIGLTGWSYTARMVRAQVLSIRERQFVERARAIGASEMAIIRRHIFPNTFPLVFANTILTVAMAILSEATLSYLRLRPADAETWGKMLSYASESSALKIGLQGWIIVPGICIVLLVLAFSLVGYALDEILNPKLRHR
jgi:peptide/nickel transport system permease protein